ncbi:MAG: MBL fold metallo-hydrolase [Cyanobacteria bacterium CRU_2_1]|nr:MBL fold metallo-hydrolase [Cyanobacteria bacterium CRU_2_1]
MRGFDSPVTNSLSVNGSEAPPVSGSSHEFAVQFWGVRGSVPTPGMETVRYGGNTACVELRVAGKRLIFDGGTGLRVLGKHLLNQRPIEAHIFFTHTHWDRIQGFPFFAPAFIEGNTFNIYGAVGQNGASIKQRLCEQMLRPNFSVPIQVMRSELRFHDIAPGSVITLDDVVVETIALHRPNSALGYRITWNGYSVVYATDTEHSPDHIDQGLLYLAHQADLLIYDVAHADYDLQSLLSGQSSATWYAGIDVAMAAQVKQIVLFHHDPAHDDDFLDQVETEVQSSFPSLQLAREGMVLQVYQEENAKVN